MIYLLSDKHFNHYALCKNQKKCKNKTKGRWLNMKRWQSEDGNIKLVNGDFNDIIDNIKDESIDLILCDRTTQNKPTKFKRRYKDAIYGE